MMCMTPFVQLKVGLFYGGIVYSYAVAQPVLLVNLDRTPL